MNRLATIFALCQVGAVPDPIAREVMRVLYFPQGGTSAQPDPEHALQELMQRNAGNIQGIMTARMYAELFAGYEDLGMFGSAIKFRARKGIFERYVTGETRVAASFLQEILDSNIPEHPEITLDRLLRIPSLMQMKGLLPQEVLDQLEAYYHEAPKFLYEVAKHYRLKRGEAQAVRVGQVPSPVVWQASLTQGTMAIILGFRLETEQAQAGRLSVDVFNRIKHQFLVTANLESYADPEDGRSLEFAFLPQEQAFIDGIVLGVSYIAKVMGDLALFLLLLDDHGIAL